MCFKRWQFLWVLAAILLWSNMGLAANEILVGFSGPLSGPAAEYGRDIVDGIEMAVHDINTAGGITVKGKKYTFKLQKLDDKIDTRQSVANAVRFRADGAVAVFNGLFHTVAGIAGINQAKGNEFILMAFTSTPRMLDLKNKLAIFPHPSTIIPEAYANWALSKGWKRCGMMITLGSYGDDWRKTFKTIFERKGGTIVADKPANYYTETDFSSPLTAVIAANPEVMLIGGPSATTALVIEQARSVGYKGGFMMIDQAKPDVIEQMLKDPKLLGNMISNARVDGLPRTDTQVYYDRFLAKYKRPYAWEGVINYNMMRALARAIVAAGTVDDIYKIRAAFPKAYPMLAGKFPTEHLGLTEEGGFLAWGATQTATEGKFNPPTLYASWPKTQKEWDSVVKTSNIPKSIVKKWLRPEK